MQYTIFYVKSPEKSANFYKDLFDLEITMMTPEKDYAELNASGTKLAFVRYDLADSNLSKGYQKPTQNDLPIPVELAFEVKNIQDFINKALNIGGSLYEDITKKEWGQELAYIRDLDGFLIALGTPMDY